MKFKIDGREVRRVRELRGWTQQELARQAEVSRTLIVRVESDQREDLRVSAALRIATALGLPLERIVRPSVSTGDHSLLVMMRYLEDLTPPERDSVQQFVEFVLASRKVRGKSE